LIICRALCDFFNAPALKGQIAFRGGTAVRSVMHGLGSGSAGRERAIREYRWSGRKLQRIATLTSTFDAREDPIRCRERASTA
jgi:hypothetical protein